MQPSHSLKPRADVFNEEPLDHHRAHTVALARAVVRKPRRPVAIRRPDLYPWPAHHPRGHAAACAGPAQKRSTRAPSYANLGIQSHPNAQTSSPFGNASPESVPVPAHHPRGHAAAHADPVPKRSTHANLGIHSHPDAQTASLFSNPSLGSVSMASGPSSRARSCICRSGSQTFDSSTVLRKPRHT